MGIIRVEGIKLFGYHGCMEEEAKIGGNYVVDIELTTNFSEAAAEDDLSKTIDYVTVNRIVQQEMAIRSKLIEHVGRRIINRLKADIPAIDQLRVTVKKINPPINGNVDMVSVTLHL